jgi:hypothetical protein
VRAEGRGQRAGRGQRVGGGGPLRRVTSHESRSTMGSRFPIPDTGTPSPSPCRTASISAP